MTESFDSENKNRQIVSNAGAEEFKKKKKF